MDDSSHWIEEYKINLNSYPLQAAQLGGLEVLSVADNIHAKSKGQTKEGANDPLTNADLKSHCAMEQGLKRIFPKVKIISEEDVHADCAEASHFELDPTVIDEDVHLPDELLVGADDVTVWIDPLDATQEYTGKENPTFQFKRPFLSMQLFLLNLFFCFHFQNLYFNMLRQWCVWRFVVNRSSESFTTPFHR